MLYRHWWVKYYRAGKMYRESSGSTKRDAKDLLRRREGSIASGTFTGLKPEKTTLPPESRMD